MNYFVKTPWWLKKIYSSYLWDIETKEKIIYLTFDDGPHPVATPFVLDELKKYNAKATFFCIGKNVAEHPKIYKRILDEGHQVGNHTQNHLNGWESNNDIYLNDITAATNHIDSELFRPPYGRIKIAQAKRISKALQKKDSKIVMWGVLSGDFDTAVSKERCLRNVIANTKSGSIVVFHDSEKAWNKMSYCLPLFLKEFISRGFAFEKIN
jgi:peptidoglycan-N-acetylglucosamine deacetylase